MMSQARTLEIRTSPHILSGASVDSIMFNVVLALLPTTAFAISARLLSVGTSSSAGLSAKRAATKSVAYWRCRWSTIPTGS